LTPESVSVFVLIDAVEPGITIVLSEAALDPSAPPKYVWANAGDAAMLATSTVK
jgi:hypothetical protein